MTISTSISSSHLKGEILLRQGLRSLGTQNCVEPTSSDLLPFKAFNFLLLLLFIFNLCFQFSYSWAFDHLLFLNWVTKILSFFCRPEHFRFPCKKIIFRKNKLICQIQSKKIYFNKNIISVKRSKKLYQNIINDKTLTSFRKKKKILCNYAVLKKLHTWNDLMLSIPKGVWQPCYVYVGSFSAYERIPGRRCTYR